MRRAVLTVLAAAAVLLAVPTAAFADATVTFVSPESGATVTGQVDLVIDVERRLIDPHPSQVVLELSVDGVEPHPDTGPVELTCVANCEGDTTTTTSRWQGPSLSAATLAPFQGAPACNGQWRLLPTVDAGPTTTGGESHGAFVAAAPPSPVGDLSVTTDAGDVVLSWTAAAEDDVSGYRIQRAADGGSWNTLATLEPSASTYRDASPAEGTYDYRVVTLRPDGLVDGEPAPACEDTGQDLTTPSKTWRVTVASDGATAAPTGGDGETSENTTEEPTEDPSEQPSSEQSPSPSPSPSEGGSTTASGDGGARQRIAAGSSGSSGQLTAPQTRTPEVAAPRERYFGEGEAFEDRLDYDGVNTIEAAADPGFRMERVAGGTVEIFDRQLDLAHILRPIAAGLVLIAIALHLRRWMRA